MFEIGANDIALLSEEDLRALVGRLCESELRSRGFSASSATWGGHQNAADGGLDIRVALPSSTAIDGFVPRPSTGFQVKKSDMPRAKILKEMSPLGVVKPIIKELADHSGAYIIVSSKGSTSDSALQDRQKAMVEAVKGLANANSLTLDFYDRNRLATWVRDHPASILWVREKIGKAIPGWHSYGAWAYSPEGASGEYLLDNRLRIQTGKKEAVDGYQALEGIQQIRDLLQEPKSVIRLVGVSGVGKTRLVQALFDDRIGERSLDPSLAIYTNMADRPDPQPTGLASDLLAARSRAILVIDNCPPDLHRRISELCRGPESMISVITVEYDIREDEPEGTEVIKLETSSVELLEKLVKHRFPELSVIDAQTVAEFSGGNARIAITLAGTIGKNETIAGLTDEELFHRLVHQRHEPDESLLLAAQVCSLVYSFQGEDVSDGDQAELARLGAMIGKNAQEMFRHIAELQRRDLVQQRSVWRAVLPHAIANHLAAIALQNIPIAAIKAHLVNGAPVRILKSFSRRLGYLHDRKEAVAIVNQWLAEGGLLADVAALNDLGKAMFHNVAPVAPDGALSVLERAFLEPVDDEALQRCSDYVRLLRSLAYDAALFERCATLILRIAEAGDVNDQSNEARNVFISLFPIYLSGTHATIEQRLRFIEPLLLSEDADRRTLGLMALKAALEAWHFGSLNNFEFGARSRDHGYWPRTAKEIKHWFGLTLKLSENLACSDGPSASHVRAALAEKFRGLWVKAGMYDELEQVCRVISRKQFWREGWISVRQTLNFDSKAFAPGISARLASLEELLRPADLVQKVRAIVLSKRSDYFDLDDLEDDNTHPLQNRFERLESIAHNLGKSVAADEKAFEELLAELVSAEGRLLSFGRGLAEGAKDTDATWTRLVTQLSATAESQRKVLVLGGFLNMLHATNPELANVFLDVAVENDALAAWYPVLQSAVTVDKRGVDRLKRSIALGKAPVWNYRYVAGGGAADSISGPDLNALILGIASKPEGLNVAIEILGMRLHSEKDGTPGWSPEIIDAGRELMERLTFTTKNRHEDYELGLICNACLTGEKGAAVVQGICHRLKDSVSKYETYGRDHEGLLEGMFSAQPSATLDGLCAGDAAELELGVRIIDEVRQFRKNLLDVVPEGELICWCDQEPHTRYVAMAAAITFSEHSEKAGPRQWTQIALRLLEKAPDRVQVLKRFIRQFSPMSWSGSLAAVVESNAKLLDTLEEYSDPAVVAFVRQEKTRLRQAIESERRAETVTDSVKDERFE